MNEVTFTFQDYTTRVVFLDSSQALSLPYKPTIPVIDEHLFQVINNKQIPGLENLPWPESNLNKSESSWVTIPSGEEHKAWEQVNQILTYGVQLGIPRDGVLFAVGGGVVTDLAAFASSVYMRGIELILVPTTLLAMVDAAFGGKTGINFMGYKNLVGTFYPAQEIRISVDFLQTLPEREFKSGLAEVIKSGLLQDPQLIDLLVTHKDQLLERQPEVLKEVVYRSLAVKGRIVEADLREQGIRAHLNLGHTFAHALESVAGFGTWTHGEAVAWGIGKALDLGIKIGLTNPSYAQQVKDLLIRYDFNLTCDQDPEQLLKAMEMDKKKSSGTLKFVLQRDLADTLVKVVDSDQVRAVLSS